MKTKYLALALSVTCLSGCALPTDQVGKFTAGTATADTTVKNLLAGRAALIAEVEFSKDSRDYISGTFFDRRGNSNSCDRGIKYEEILQEKRLSALTELDEYVKALQVYLSPSKEFAAATNIITAASSLGSSLGLQGAAGASVVTALTAAAAQAEVAARAAALVRLAQAKQETVEKISSSLKAGLKPINSEYAAILNNWEVCEFEKLHIIDKSDAQASKVEKEGRFRLFYDMRAKLKASLTNAVEAEAIFDELPKLHKKIIEGGTDIGKNLDVLGKTIGAGQALVAAGQAAAAPPTKSGS